MERLYIMDTIFNQETGSNTRLAPLQKIQVLFLFIEIVHRSQNSSLKSNFCLLIYSIAQEA